MKDYSELISRFDSIADLPVSEETLGAYCEGTLGDADTAAVAESIASDTDLSALLDSVDSLQVSDSLSPFSPDEAQTDDIELPDVPAPTDIVPFGFDIGADMGSFGMVAAAAATPIFCGGLGDSISADDDFLSNNDDSFFSDNPSSDTEDDIDNDDSFDGLNIDEL